MKLLLTISITILCLLSHAQKIDMRLNVESKEKYKSIFTIDFGKEDLGMQMKLEFTQEYNKLENNNYDIDVLYTRLYTGIVLMGDSMAYDSDQPVDEPFSNVMDSICGEMVGVPMKIVMDQKGVLLSSNIDSVLSEIDPSQGDNMNKQMEQQFVEFPPKPIKIGKSWNENKVSYSATTGEPLNMKTKYTLVRKDEKYFYVSISGTMKSQESDMKGVIKGLMKFDINTHIQTDSSWRMDITIQGQEIPVFYNITTSKVIN